jgi:hypothetical protein
MKIRCYNIRYDTDGLKVKLPKELFFESDEPDFDPHKEAADLISDKTSWCVFSFSLEEVKEIPAAASAGYTLIEMLVCIFLGFVACGVVAIIWVVCHFLAKVW